MNSKGGAVVRYDNSGVIAYIRYRYLMYKYYTTDSPNSQLRNHGLSQDTLHSSPIFTATSRGVSLVRSQCTVPYRRARAVHFNLDSLYWESEVFNSLKPSEAYIGEVSYAFLGSDNELSPVV